MSDRYILTLSCHDVCGIVAAVAGFIASHDGFIIESAQFGDASTERFFLRMEFASGSAMPDHDMLRQRFYEQVAKPFAMDWKIHNKSQKSRVIIMVSKHGHCLNDLLYRHATDQLAIDIPAVISNHEDFKSVVEWHHIPFYHFPLVAGGKAEQEGRILETFARHQGDVLVLARYMQILSAEACATVAGKAINIHHSFLPSFKGARPYQQAYDRGVKLIGATAHYVTTALDEGPIIEQEVARVDHTHSPEDLAAIGRDLECLALARALKFHTEQRVLMNGVKTVIFR